MPRIIPARLPPLRDRIRPGVRVLFVGINPGIRSALTGHHFAGYSNRFWKLLYDSALVPEPVTYEDDDRLPGWGFGITNLVARPTPGVGDLRRDELPHGRARLLRTIRRYRPAIVALVGLTVFRALFPERRGAVGFGLRPERLAGSAVFVLPNPSGRNAHYSYEEMRQAFAALSTALRERRWHET
ncbi:MAG TPA: mismatch-specific DNA-glycosylase [Vicinamibacterales bacterium]